MTLRHLRNVRGFFSDYYLGSVFGRPAGRGRRKVTDRAADAAFARFRRIRERTEGSAEGAPECRERFIRPLLRDVLGFHLGAGDDRLHGLYPSADAEAAGQPRVAAGPVIELKSQGRTYALAPSEVVRLCREKSIALKGDFEIVAGTEAESLHPAAAEDDDEDSLDVDDEADEDADSEDGEAGESEDRGLRKGAPALLLRRLQPGTFHFVPGPGRKGSGSFYTPRPLAQDPVRHAIGPLVEGRTAAEIEGLRILDPACGSAHFLVESMRFLGQALHRAYVVEGNGSAPAAFRSTTGQGWDDAWKVADDEARAAGSEARAWCKRRVAERCLFGVDLNPTAVQLARVALWVESVAGDRPLIYFEHHVRVGNSLVGSWMDGLEAPPLPATRGSGRRAGPGLFQASVRAAIEDAASLRRLIDQTPPEALRREGIEPESVAEQEYKDSLRRRADAILASAKLLFDLRSASLFVPDIWADWETLCSQVGTPGLARIAESRPWYPQFLASRDRDRYFHWEIEFPEVVLDPARAGFDVILGNPPWDKVLPARKDFYAATDVLIRAFTGGDLDRRIRELHASHPGLDGEFDEYSKRTKTTAQFLRNGGDFPLSKARTGAAHDDLSKYFLDRAIRLGRPGCAVGMIVPSVFYNGDGCVALRRYLLAEATIDRFYAFENRRKVFPIDSRYKFVSLVVRKVPSGAPFQVAFMRHEIEELDATARWREPGRGGGGAANPPWFVSASKAELEWLSPESSAFLEYRGARDQGLARRMHEQRPRLGDSEPGTWQANLFTDQAHMQIYNGSRRDSDLWTDRATGRLFQPGWVLPSMPADPGDAMELMRDRGFWPVFEGKHVEQFLVGIKPIRWWLSVEAAEKKYGRPPRPEPLLVFRETASNTNEPTCIAAVLPARSAASHKLTGVLPDALDPLVAATVLNSLVFDYGLRMRTAGTSVSFTYIQPMAVPAPAALVGLRGVATRLAWKSGIDHITDDETAWPDLWAANRAVAEAYGLDPDDFAHVLSAFPVMARKRPAFVAYLHERLAEWAGGK
ncbi:MAG: N-6 DNA methylase [Deltaproteobacteria bacterium]|nr:N-6 DNA methylase [Deltaproteobacteria bacterium]